MSGGQSIASCRALGPTPITIIFPPLLGNGVFPDAGFHLCDSRNDGVVGHA
jgi:hypothetical protein